MTDDEKIDDLLLTIREAKTPEEIRAVIRAYNDWRLGKV